MGLTVSVIMFYQNLGLECDHDLLDENFIVPLKWVSVKAAYIVVLMLFLTTVASVAKSNAAPK